VCKKIEYVKTLSLSLSYATIQSQAYLKDILREVCIYNTKMPHKNMWELKAEYRHYEKGNK